MNQKDIFCYHNSYPVRSYHLGTVTYSNIGYLITDKTCVDRFTISQKHLYRHRFAEYVDYQMTRSIDYVINY